MASGDWVERVTSLNQWRRGGERAPHKPLLLLYAIGQLQRTGSSSMAFADVETDLKRLLEEFGPPRNTSPGYPFHHLTTDGLWAVRTPAGVGSRGPNLGDLRAAIVRAILDENFPATLHQDILDACGITLEPVEVPEVAKTARRRRDPSFRERVLVAYEYRCVFCGYDGQLSREAVGIDAAHIR